MGNRTLIYLFFILVLVFFPVPETGEAQAASKPSSFRYTRIFYYQEGKLARASLFTYPSSIDVLAPQAYSFRNGGTLSGEVKENILAFAQKHKIKVMPLVTNRNFSQASLKALLSNPAEEDRAIVELVTEAKENGYWGWQFDFEQMDISYRDTYSAFVVKAAEAFKKEGLVLSVAVFAQVSENPDDYPNDLWRRIIGVYDYAALAQAADFVTVMAYDDPQSKGPVAGLPWVKDVLSFSLTKIPPEKISLGLGLYYWLRNDTTGKVTQIGGNEGIQNVFKKHKVGIHFSRKQQVPYIEFWSRAKPYTLWYENGNSVKRKLSLVKENKLHGFSAWVLGLEHPSIYAVVRQ